MEDEKTVVLDTSIADAKKQARKDALAKGRATAKANREAKKNATPAITVKDPEIIWFTELDYNEKGGVAADFPAYYFDTRELREDIRQLSEQLEDGVFTGKKKREQMTRLKSLQDKLDKTENGRPKLAGQTKDKVAAAVREVGEQIKESMFSYDSHWKQTADPHEVARRMVEPCIEVKNPIVASFMKQRGFEMKNNMVNQTAASIFFKVGSKLIDEGSDTDRLRPVRAHGNVI